MPYKSEAQRKKFQALYQEGKISKATLAEFNNASAGLVLPPKVKQEKPKKPPRPRR